MTKNEVDINYIVRANSSLPKSRLEGPLNKTSLFLLHCIDIKRKIFQVKKHFINAFIADEGEETALKNCIYVLLGVKNFRDRVWREANILLKVRNKNYVRDYYVGYDFNLERHLIMMVFQIPEKNLKNYHHFLKGEYSKFTEDYKEHFTDYNLTDPHENNVWGAVFKTKDLKATLKRMFFDREDFYIVDELNELWGLMVPEREVFRHKNLGNNADNLL